MVDCRARLMRAMLPVFTTWEEAEETTRFLESTSWR